MWRLTYKSLYPSIDIENNIASNTQIGKIVIDEKVYEYENRYCDDKYTRGGEFIENLVCDNILEFSSRWLQLASFSEMLNDIKEYYTIKFNTMYGYKYLYNDCVYENGRYIISPFVLTDKDYKIQPFEFVNNNGFNPFRSYVSRPET